MFSHPNLEVHATYADVTKASVLAEFFVALAILSWDELRALKPDL